MEEKIIIRGIAALSHLWILGGIEEIVGHELDDQRDVDVDRSLKLGQRANIPRGHLKVHVLFKALGRDDVPQQVDDLLALRRHLHLDDGIVEQIAPVLGRSRAHVVGRAQRKQFHRHQARVSLGEHLLDVREIGHGHAIQLAIGGVMDRFVKGMRANADGGPAQIVLADVDRVERGVPRGLPFRENVRFGDGIIVQRKVGDIVLRLRADVPDEVIVAGGDSRQ